VTEVAGSQIPLLIKFAAGTRLFREPDLPQGLRILQNGPPGTFVTFAAGLRVSLPTDQIIYADDTGKGARVGFGGMSFAGVEGGRLVFHRLREIHPEHQLSPARSMTMVLQVNWVASIWIDGQRVNMLPR
jgi:hypothetical protein